MASPRSKAASGTPGVTVCHSSEADKRESPGQSCEVPETDGLFRPIHEADFLGVVMDVLYRDTAWESSVPITAAVGELAWTSAGVLRVVAAAQGVSGRMVWLVDTEAGQWVSALAQMGDMNSAIELRQTGLVDITLSCGSP